MTSSATSPSTTSIVDLCYHGVCPGLAAAVFVVICQAEIDVAGPSVILATLLAATVAACTSVCYAELRCRWPLFTGAAYDYAYFSGGEAVAFLVAWFTLLQHVCSVSLLARGVSVNVDVLLNYRMFNLTLDNVGQIPYLDGTVPVFLAGFLVLALTTIASLGIATPRYLSLSAIVCTLMLTLSAGVVALFHIDFTNWTDFFPSKFDGVIHGAGTVYCAFTFFEIIANRSDLIGRGGRSTVLSTLLTSLVYLVVMLGVGGALSLLDLQRMPRTEATYAEIYDCAGLPWTRYFIAFVAVITLLISLWESILYGSSRLQMFSKDGLVFAWIHWTKSEDESSSPVPAFVIGIISVILSTIFNLTDLVQMTSFASLLVYLICVLVVIILRYSTPKLNPMSSSSDNAKKRERRKRSSVGSQSCFSYGSTSNGISRSGTHSSLAHDESMIDLNGHSAHPDSSPPQLEDHSSDSEIDDIVEEYRHQAKIRALTSCVMGFSSGSVSDAIPSDTSQRRATASLMCIAVAVVIMSTVLSYGEIASSKTKMVFCLAVLALGVLLIVMSILTLLRQPSSQEDLSEVAILTPCWPWFPLITLVLLLHLIINLISYIWLPALLWFVIGAGIYLGYGMRHSRGGYLYNILPTESQDLLPDSADRLDTSSQSSLLPDGDVSLIT